MSFGFDTAANVGGQGSGAPLRLPPVRRDCQWYALFIFARKDPFRRYALRAQRGERIRGRPLVATLTRV